MDEGWPLRILVVGPDYAGKTTLVGHLLYKCGQLGPEMREALRKQKEDKGKEPNQWVESLRVQDGAMCPFWRVYKSPRYEAIVAGSATSGCFPGGLKALCAVLVVPASRWEFEASLDLIRWSLFSISQLGVKHTVICVNKMDMTCPPYSQPHYGHIRQEVLAFIGDLGRYGYSVGSTVDFLPISALVGDNLQEASPQTAWFEPQPLEGRTGGALVGLTLHQLLSSFSSRKPRRPPSSPQTGWYSDQKSWDSSPNPKGPRTPVRHVNHPPLSSAGSSCGPRSDPLGMSPGGEPAQQDTAHGEAGGPGAGVAGGPSDSVANPPQSTLGLSGVRGRAKASPHPFCPSWPPVRRQTLPLPSPQQDISSSSSSSFCLQFVQEMALALPCVPHPALPEEAPPCPAWANWPDPLPIRHQTLPTYVASRYPLGQPCQPGLQDPPDPVALPPSEQPSPLDLQPHPLDWHPSPLDQQPLDQQPLTLPQHHSIFAQLLPPLPQQPPPFPQLTPNFSQLPPPYAQQPLILPQLPPPFPQQPPSFPQQPPPLPQLPPNFPQLPSPFSQLPPPFPQLPPPFPQQPPPLPWLPPPFPQLPPNFPQLPPPFTQLPPPLAHRMPYAAGLWES